MLRQETFLTVRNGDETVEVLKTHDEGFAREAFRSMDEDALSHLAQSLNLESLFAEGDFPTPTDENYEDLVWEAMVDEAREDWNAFSYFVVTKTTGRKTEELFVSADWATAEAYVKRLGLTDASTSQNSID